MKKATINMLSSATKIRGQGVGSAYIEQVNLVRSGLSKEFDIFENKVMQADITHYHTIDLKFALSQKALSKRGRSVGYVHMLPETVEQSIDLPAPMKKVFFWYMIRFYKLMDHLVTVNPYFIGELAKYGVPREKVTYIPNFVSEADFHPLNQNERRTLRRKYHLDEARFTVVCAGQLQHRKGVLDFVEIAKRMPNVQFVHQPAPGLQEQPQDRQERQRQRRPQNRHQPTAPATAKRKCPHGRPMVVATPASRPRHACPLPGNAHRHRDRQGQDRQKLRPLYRPPDGGR